MELFNWTAAESGLIFVMLSFSIIIDPFIGRLTDAHGCRGITVSGLALGIVVWIAMCFVTTNTTAAKIILFILIFVVGFSTALMVTPNMVEISRAVDAISQSSLAGKSDPSKVMGRAYSLLNMSWGLGSIIGPLWGGSIIQEWGWVVMCSSFVVLQSFSTVFAFRYAGERLDDEDEEDEI
jgi:MFS family permease